MPLLPLPLQVLAASLTLVAAVCDWRTRRIPNWLTVSGLAVGLAIRGVLLGWSGLLSGLQGFGLAVLIYLAFYLVRAMGGGDLKLMAALGAVAGPGAWFTIFLITSILGGIVALVLLLWHKAFRRGLRRVGRILLALIRGRAPYHVDSELDIASSAAITSPHGIAIAGGTWIYLCLGWLAP